MRLDLFRYEFRRVNGFLLAPNVILFRKPKIELYDVGREETIGLYRRLEDLLDEVVQGKTVRQYIEEMDHITFSLDGGRGSDSGLPSFSFGHAGRSSLPSIIKPDFPARFNAEDVRSVEGTLSLFREKHVMDNKESCITVDAQGFTTSYVHGDSTSCAIGNTEGLVIHNHPGKIGGNFSDTDLFSCANGKFTGVVAVGREGTYIFRKTHKFRATDFTKAVMGAKMHGADYNEATNRWLRMNRKKYGYEYEFIPAEGG